MWDGGYEMEDAGCRCVMWDAGSQMQNMGCRTKDTGCRIWDALLGLPRKT